MSRPGTVLLVEDNAAEVELALVALREVASLCSVVVARDGVEACTCLFGGEDGDGGEAKHEFHLVLLDLKLPRIDGLDVLKRIREDRSLRQVFVAVLTSSSREADRSEALRLGANLFLQKAVDFDEFTADLRRIMELAAATG